MGVVSDAGADASTLVLTRFDEVYDLLPVHAGQLPHKVHHCQPPVDTAHPQVLWQRVLLEKHTQDTTEHEQQGEAQIVAAASEQEKFTVQLITAAASFKYLKNIKNMLTPNKITRSCFVYDEHNKSVVDNIEDRTRSESRRYYSRSFISLM